MPTTAELRLFSRDGSSSRSEHQERVISVGHEINVLRHAQPLVYADPNSPISEEGERESELYPYRYKGAFCIKREQKRVIRVKVSPRLRTRQTGDGLVKGFRQMAFQEGFVNTVVLDVEEDPELQTTDPFLALMTEFNTPREQLQQRWEELTAEEGAKMKIRRVEEVGRCINAKVLREIQIPPKVRDSGVLMIDFWVTHEPSLIGVATISQPNERFVKYAPLETIRYTLSSATGYLIQEVRGKRFSVPDPSCGGN